MRYRIEFPLTNGETCAVDECTLEDAIKFARRLSNEPSKGGNWWKVIDSRTGRKVADSNESL